MLYYFCNLYISKINYKINYCQISAYFFAKHLHALKKSLPLQRFKKAIDCFT